MQRPIGVTILALVAGLAGAVPDLADAGLPGRRQLDVRRPDGVSSTTRSGARPSGRSSSPPSGSGSPSGFWNVRAYAWSFGNFIALFTIIFGFFALLGNAGTTESETVGWLLSIGVFFYLNYPGVRNAFMEHEMSLLNPAQRAAMEQMQAAQMAMAQATAAPAAAAPAPAAPPPAAPPPPAPPADPGTPSS